MTRCMRKNRLSKRLSTSSSKIEDDDSNDLIKATSETASLARPSVDSTTTIVHHSFCEVLASESPNRLQLRTNMNMRTLFDQTPISPTDHARQAFTNQEYPIFKLDMCQSRFEAPKTLEAAMETTDWRKNSTDIKNGYHNVDGGDITPTEKDPKRNRRSMAAMFKRHCGLNIPRSSLSLKGDDMSPRWLDSAGVGEDEALIDMRNEKLLGAHMQDQKKNSIKGGRFGRPW